MPHTLTKQIEHAHKVKHGITLDVLPSVGDVGIVRVMTAQGHNQEFYDTVSTFTYIILQGEGSFYLDDVEVKVSRGDVLSVEPGTRIYYKGFLEMILVTEPAWVAENQVETKSPVW